MTFDPVNEATLAAFLGVSASRCRELARDGVLRKVARGRYDLPGSVAAYCERLREAAARAGRPSATTNDELKAEKLRLAREQADALALKNAATRGEMLPAANVERTWTDAVAAARAALLAVPSRAAARAALDKGTIAILDDELRLALKALSDGNG